MATYDKRPARAEAEALVARRIDHSALRYPERKAMLGLPADAKLADHAELVTIRQERMPNIGVTPYWVLVWGVKVNGCPAGYVHSNYAGDRHQFLPYWWGDSSKTTELPGAAEPAARPAPALVPPTEETAAAPGYPKLTHQREESGRNPVDALFVQYRKGGPRYRIGTVRKQGSLPSMASWHAKGIWDGAEWTIGYRTRGAADQAVLTEWAARLAAA
jgi:hypothetical protein